MILINMGHLLMLLVWGFLLFHLIQPFHNPLKYFLDIGLFFMVVMHALQLTLLKATLTKDEAAPRAFFQTRVFLSACLKWSPGRGKSGRSAPPAAVVKHPSRLRQNMNAPRAGR